MSVIDSVRRLAGPQWQGFVAFDWRLVLQPSGIGSWPSVPRQMALLLCVLSVLTLVFTVSVVLKPRISPADYALLEMFEEKIRAQQEENSVVAAQQLARKKQNFYAYALLQHDPAQKADVTKMMDVVRAAAHTSGAQLLLVSPQILPDNELAMLRLSARLTLSSLSSFWLFLMETDFSFGIKKLALELTEKQEIFELHLDLMVPVNPEIALPALRYPARYSLEESDHHNANNLCPEALCAVAVKQKMKSSEGFLLRSGSSRIFYLIRDDKGNLRGVEE